MPRMSLGEATAARTRMIQRQTEAVPPPTHPSPSELFLPAPEGTMASFFTSLFQWFSGRVPCAYLWYRTAHG